MSAKSPRIDPRELKRLSVLRPHRTLLAIGFDWAIIAGAIAFSKVMQHPLAYVAAVMVIAGRMHAFGCLMHEAAHYRIIRNRKLSDWMSDLLAALVAYPAADAEARRALYEATLTGCAGFARHVTPEARDLLRLFGTDLGLADLFAQLSPQQTSQRLEPTTRSLSLLRKRSLYTPSRSAPGGSSSKSSRHASQKFG